MISNEILFAHLSIRTNPGPDYRLGGISNPGFTLITGGLPRSQGHFTSDNCQYHFIYINMLMNTKSTAYQDPEIPGPGAG